MSPASSNDCAANAGILVFRWRPGAHSQNDVRILTTFKLGQERPHTLNLSVVVPAVDVHIADRAAANALAIAATHSTHSPDTWMLVQSRLA